MSSFPVVPSAAVVGPVPVAEGPGLPPEAVRELRAAMERLGRGPGLVSRMAEVVGTALGGAGRLVATTVLGRIGPWALRLAPGVEARMGAVAQAALTQAFQVAVVGVGGAAGAGKAGDGNVGAVKTDGRRARLLVAASGAAGGAAGLAGFAPDAAVTTLAIMRRIARIAREEGEDLSHEDARRACLEVFALRSGVPGGESEAGYFPTRLLLQGGPMVRLLTEVAARYGVQLGQKLAAQAVPVAGAVCGAALNAAFMAEYEGLARAHFTIRRLERSFGAAAVRRAGVG